MHQLLLHDIAGAFHDGVAHLRKRIVSIHARLAMHARVCENATHLEKRIRDIIEVCLEVHDDDADEVAVACAETFHRVVQLLGNKLGRVTHRAD